MRTRVSRRRITGDRCSWDHGSLAGSSVDPMWGVRLAFPNAIPNTLPNVNVLPDCVEATSGYMSSRRHVYG